MARLSWAFYCVGAIELGNRDFEMTVSWSDAAHQETVTCTKPQVVV
jgi:hypothetical protein